MTFDFSQAHSRAVGFQEVGAGEQREGKWYAKEPHDAMSSHEARELLESEAFPLTLIRSRSDESSLSTKFSALQVEKQ